MGRRDWRLEAEKVEGPLGHNTWYRSPLWEKDHLLAREKTMQEDGLAWCGRPLEDARYFKSKDYGGLWYTNRRSAQCKSCERREDEWHVATTFEREVWQKN